MKMRYVEMFYDEEQDVLILEEPNGVISKFNDTQLREAREVMHQYEEANFHPSSEENEKAFQYFTHRMGLRSPEVFDTMSPYLN
tara:strand:- start:2388 stop:2639 length:252 start_codon:yes stop_codon:yes gene_type:complete